MASTKVKLNRNWGDQFLKAASTRGALDAPAQAALGRMRAACPVESGDLQGSLEVWDDTTDRAVKRVGSRSVSYAAKVNADTGFVSRAL